MAKRVKKPHPRQKPLLPNEDLLGRWADLYKLEPVSLPPEQTPEGDVPLYTLVALDHEGREINVRLDAHQLSYLSNALNRIQQTNRFRVAYAQAHARLLAGKVRKVQPEKS